jgi:hypothetical protein
MGIPVYADLHCMERHSGHVVFPLTYQHHALFSKPSADEAGSAGASRMTSPLAAAPAPDLEASNV